MENGKFVISLDFELLWGVRDKMTIQEYGENIKGVQSVIPKLLDAFSQYGIKATFATVGFLFFKTKNELLQNLPAKYPGYSIKKYSPYVGYFNEVGEDYQKDIFHFAPLLIEKIKDYPDHEIGTHTYSHYYCLEEGQTVEEFRDDLLKAIELAEKNHIKISSLVFPRNQFNDKYLEICKELEIICYRGNEHSWLYRAKNAENENRLRRAFRLLDAYINISGHNCYDDNFLQQNYPVNIPASRFLRPFTPALEKLDRLKLKRITNGMTYAAQKNLTYHLWWHPHNFGINQDQNFKLLEKILVHYEQLNSQYGFTSITMSKLAKQVLNKKESHAQHS
jgi:peptidoglycan/xylan/chitin deacetylase (PgdA/CDA1 family)